MAQAEVEAFRNKLLTKIQGEKAAQEVIIQAIESWTGHSVNGIGQIPMVRNGEHVGYFSTPLASMMSPSHDAREVAREVWAENTPTIRSRRTAYQKLLGTLEAVANQIADMDIETRSHIFSLKETNPTGLEEKLVLAMGSVASVAIAAKVLAVELQEAITRCDDVLVSRSSGRGRPRQEARYRLAEGFAKIFAKATGDRPTYSEDENGLHGKFTPALRELFDAVGWEDSDLSGPATAACAAVNEADLEIGRNSSLGGILGLPPY